MNGPASDPTGLDRGNPRPADMEQAARSRLRRWDRVTLAVCVTAPILGIGIGVYLAGADGSGGTPSPGAVTLLVVVLLVVVGIPVAALVYRRRRGGAPALVVGADRTTRKAVQRTLRTGHTHDPHLDVLARDLAEKTLRTAYVRWVFLGAFILTGAGQILQVVGGVAWWRAATSVLLLVSTATVGGALDLNVRRSRRYLRGGPPEAG